MTWRDCLEPTIGAKGARFLVSPVPTRLWPLSPFTFTSLALAFRTPRCELTSRGFDICSSRGSLSRGPGIGKGLARFLNGLFAYPSQAFRDQ